MVLLANMGFALTITFNLFLIKYRRQQLQVSTADSSCRTQKFRKSCNQRNHLPDFFRYKLPTHIATEISQVPPPPEVLLLHQELGNIALQASLA